MSDEVVREGFLNHKRTFSEFLDEDVGSMEYASKVRAMVEQNECRLVVNINDLRRHNPGLVNDLMENPNEVIPAFQEALRETVQQISPVHAKGDSSPFYVGFEGSFGPHHVSPRGLRSDLLNHLVLVDGIVTKCSSIHPKIVRSVHYCEATKDFHFRHYRDGTSIGLGLPTSTVYPTKDDEGNLLSTEFGMCDYVDRQTVTIQEMPERAPAGQLPRSIDVLFENDLVDAVKPGDRVQIVAVFKALGGKNAGTSTGIFKNILVANNVRHLGKSVVQPTITENDISKIRDLAKQSNVVDLLSDSICPSIHGHTYIKRAVLLLLLGGLEKNLANGTHIRGDINMLMVGDPSTAKSQILRFILNVAPLALSTTGRGSSGVGLTAAVTQDPETRDRRLEAGAMVLGDRGVVCIDEFDKMSDVDRVAIHEVMEQQTVTIAKAGIHASLNARCSIVAAANPKFSQYNPDISPAQNIAMPDSLLSRFDCLFIVLDTPSPDLDRAIASRVIANHEYRNPGEEDGAPVLQDNTGFLVADEELEKEKEYEGSGEGGPVLTEALDFDGDIRSKKQICSLPFLKKYIYYAKNRFEPKLTKPVGEFLALAYASLRTKEDKKTLPVTARTMETLIRLSTAHAKARLSRNVEKQDAQAALDLLNFCIFHEGKFEHSKGPNKRARPSRAMELEDDEDEEMEMIPSPRKKTLSKKQKVADKYTAETAIPTDTTLFDFPETPLQDQRAEATATLAVGLDDAADMDDEEVLGSTPEDPQIQACWEAILKVKNSTHASRIPVDAIVDEMNSQLDPDDIGLTVEDVELLLVVLEAQDKLMYRNKAIYLTV